MARKRRKNSKEAPPVHLLIKLVGAFVLLLTFLVTSALIGAWIYFEVKVKEFAEKRSRKDFRLSTQEKEELDKLLALRDKAERRLQKIREMRNVLPLRMDGAFDGRNREGRELNAELQQLRENHEKCSVMIDDLSTREERRFRHCATIRSGLFASRCAMLLMPALLAVLCVWTPASVTGLSRFIERQTGLAPLAGVDSLYGMLVVAAWIAFAAFLILWAFGRFALVLETE